MVVVAGMNALYILRQQSFYRSISFNEKMVRNLPEACFTCSNQGFSAERTITWVPNAVDQNKGYLLEGFQFFLHNVRD